MRVCNRHGETGTLVSRGNDGTGYVAWDGCFGTSRVRLDDVAETHGGSLMLPPYSWLVAPGR